ncbi:kelch-like protein 6 [Branchiostoma floridae]|uniref:Kelch-like protein 6 n=1 Tax=Branchiostoma floridae TaxID=7739 RepID=A0A9J7HIM7_BRAFL|nr:kelch-like protein 6 [Branchiostoma floridae]
MATADRETHVSAVRPRSYQDESYLHGFLGTVCDLQKAAALQDVVLEVEGRRFSCHRLVLSAASPYFRAMFTSDMAESRQKTVVLQGLNACMFGDILSYIYSGTLHVSMDKVQPLYQAADLLQLDYVRDTCSSYMAMNVERSTCVDLYKFADVFSVEIVQKQCQQWIARHFTEVSSSEEFCSLSVNQLTEIIRHDELDVKEETTVWEAVVRWVQHSRRDRLHHLPILLPHIRFILLTSDDKAAILEHPLVKEDPGSSEVIRNVVQKGNPDPKPRFGMFTEMALLLDPTKGLSKEIFFMNPRKGKYISCTYKPEEFPGATDMTVTSGNDIYVLISCVDQLSLYKYNHAKNVWEQAGVSSTSRGQIFEYLYAVDEILYCICSADDGLLLQMRKYNPHTNHWQECSQLQFGKPIDDIAILSCGLNLYFMSITEMHCYDPGEDKWYRRTPPMVYPEFCAAVAMGTEIFCTDYYLTQTMVYNTESDSWQKLKGCPVPENHDEDGAPGLFVLENQLHALLTCIGEEDEDECHIYVYERSADAWKDLNVSIPNKRYHAHDMHCPVARIYLPYLNGT